MSAARVRLTGDEEWPVVWLSGDVDLSNVDDLARRLEEAVPNRAQGLVLDLSGVGYLDSTGLRLLFRMARQLADRQQALRIVVPPDSLIRRVLALGGVGAVAAVLPDHEALAAAASEES